MARDITGLRVAKSYIDHDGTAAANSLELDFDLARGEGISIDRVEFDVEIGGGTTFVTGAPVDRQVHLALHAENDALEDAFEDKDGSSQFQRDSEIIAEGHVELMIFDDDVNGNGGASINWLSPFSWDYRVIAGRPLILAINPTFQVHASASDIEANAQCTLYYRYVELSAAEIRDAFFRSR